MAISYAEEKLFTREDHDAQRQRVQQGKRANKHAIDLAVRRLTMGGDRKTRIFSGDASIGSLKHTRPSAASAILDQTSKFVGEAHFHPQDEYLTSQVWFENPGARLSQASRDASCVTAVTHDLQVATARVATLEKEQEKKALQKTLVAPPPTVSVDPSHSDVTSKRSAQRPGKWRHDELTRLAEQVKRARKRRDKLAAQLARLQARSERAQNARWSIHALKVCDNPVVLARLGAARTAPVVVHRDRNASKNILWLGRRARRGAEPMAAFARAKAASAPTTKKAKAKAKSEPKKKAAKL